MLSISKTLSFSLKIVVVVIYLIFWILNTSDLMTEK